jgi:hypothetical protein
LVRHGEGCDGNQLVQFVFGLHRVEIYRIHYVIQKLTSVASISLVLSTTTCLIDVNAIILRISTT